MPRLKKQPEKPKAFLRPMIGEGKHITDQHISKIRCYIDDPSYSRLDIAIAVGVRVHQVNYVIRKIQKHGQKEQIPGN